MVLSHQNESLSAVYILFSRKTLCPVHHIAQQHKLNTQRSAKRSHTKQYDMLQFEAHENTIIRGQNKRTVTGN